MKLFLLFLILAVALASAAVKRRSKAEEDKIFDDYLQKFKKNRGRSDNEKRRKIFIDRFYEIEEHNEKFQKGEELFERGLNELSDLTQEEILKNWTGGKVSRDSLPRPSGNNTVPPLPQGGRRGKSTPDNWNWAWYTVVQPVQNQGGCGSCYAFSAIGAIEGSMCRYFGQCVKLSEQEAMECTNGCDGGWTGNVFDYTKRLGGAAYASNYPYKEHVTKGCEANGPRVPKSKNTDWYFLPRGDPEGMKNFIYNFGPLSVIFDVYDAFFDYKSGIFNTCSGSNVGGHAVLITGFGEENGNKYWIAKNSWGWWWGDGGYFKILRGNNCAYIEDWALFPWTE